LGWALFALLSARFADVLGPWETVTYFAAVGMGIAFTCNLLRGIQDGQGSLRVFGAGLLASSIGLVGGVLGGLLIQVGAGILQLSAEDFLPRLAVYVLVGTVVGITSRLTSIDRTTALAALGGALGGLLAVTMWFLLERSESAAAGHSSLLIAMTLGFGIGAATYSLPSWVEGGTLVVLTGQFKKQRKAIETEDILIGNNKRQLQWVLPKWEGVQDPHARIEVTQEGRGYRHDVRNLCSKTLMVLRDGRKIRVHPNEALELEDGDVLVFATGKNYVKVRYRQRQSGDDR
jgi:hypothetical protein